MISAFLVGFVLYAMLAGRYPWPFPIVIAVVAGLAYRILAHHEHHTLLPIDRYARDSRFREMPAGEKLFFCIPAQVYCSFPLNPDPALCCSLFYLEALPWNSIFLENYLQKNRQCI